MATLKADRRLYETADRDAVVEEGDPRGRWLLAGLTRTIGESAVKKYGLTMEGGRVMYPGSPKEFAELDPVVKEHRAHRDKMLAKGGDKAEAEPDPSNDPVMRIGHSSAVRDDGKGNEVRVDRPQHAHLLDAGEEGSEDSDRNTEELAEWKLKSTPQEYLEQYGSESRNSELAQAHVDAATDGGSGDA